MLKATRQHGSPENGQVDDLQSLTWRAISESNIIILNRLIKEIVQNDKSPPQLLEATNTILETLSHIKMLPNQKEDFEKLLADASGLVCAIWKSYNPKYQSIWPPRSLGKVIAKLVKTLHRIHGFMTRKCETKLAKRMLVGCFGIRDLGKFKRYQRKFDLIASDLEGKLNNINIKVRLLEIVKSRAQPQDQNTQLSVQSGDGDLFVNNGGKHKPVIQEPVAEDTRLKSSAVKLVNQKVIYGEAEEADQSEYKALVNRKVKNRDEDDSEDEDKVGYIRSAGDISAKTKTGIRRPEEQFRPTKADEEVLRSDNKGKRTTCNLKPIQTHNLQENNTDVPIGSPVNAKRPVKKKPTGQNGRPQSAEVSSPSSISGFSFHNQLGVMTNANFGNISNSTYSDVNNTSASLGTK